MVLIMKTIKNKKENSVFKDINIYNILHKLNDVCKFLCEDTCFTKLSKNTHQRLVSFEVAINMDNHINVSFYILSGPFNENTHTFTRTYYTENSITNDEITNHLIHSLTFQGSPYYLTSNKKFAKMMIVVG